VSCVVNVDVGTGSGRAIAFDEQGRQLASSQREWLPLTDPRYPGAQDFDCDRGQRWFARRRVEPQPAAVSVYREAYKRWLKVNDRLLGLSDDGVLPSLWRAPGV
jgi:sugar (pentulose or hexulose) kinase